MLPLKGILVLDFSQYLSGPSASLRLADLGARTIKIERPNTGDACRGLTNSGLKIGDDSLLFHTINRNKESFTADLKNPEDKKIIIDLIKKADVMIQNFRPGVMEKIGLGYESVKAINPKIVYATISGYGTKGEWVKKPGQDLLVQSTSGIMHLTGNSDTPPTPLGVSVADTLAGTALTQGILACLVRRGITNQGGLVEVSLLEALLDLQFEVLTTHFNDGYKLPQRGAVNNANAYLGAPYGVYKTEDGYMALAMGSILQLSDVLNCEELKNYPDSDTWFTKRDEIKLILVNHLKTQKTSYWLEKLEAVDYWCSEVLDWHQLLKTDGFKSLGMLQTVTNTTQDYKTTRCPIAIDGERLYSDKCAPLLGEDTDKIKNEFNL